jgi:hypothetical protein
MHVVVVTVMHASRIGWATFDVSYRRTVYAAAGVPPDSVVAAHDKVTS